MLRARGSRCRWAAACMQSANPHRAAFGMGPCEIFKTLSYVGVRTIYVLGGCRLLQRIRTACVWEPLCPVRGYNSSRNLLTKFDHHQRIRQSIRQGISHGAHRRHCSGTPAG